MNARSLKAILRGAAHPNAVGRGGRTPVHRAAHDGRVEDLRILLQHGGNVHLEDDEQGECPLELAARRSHIACVELLLAAGASPNHIPAPSKSIYRESALCSVAAKSDETTYVPILEILLRAGADPNVTSATKRSPLHEAASRGNVTMVKALLTAGAKPDLIDFYGGTALHRAITYHSANPEVVKLLLRAGANPNTPDGNGEPPIFAFVSHSRYSGDRQISLDLIKTLLAAGPDLTVTDRNGMQPLALLVESGDRKDVAALLRAAGAPEPPPDLRWGPQRMIVTDPETGEPTELEVSFSGGESPEEQELVPEASAIAAEAQAIAATLPLQSPYGWKVSRAHWQFLSAAKKPKALVNFAYFLGPTLSLPPAEALQEVAQVLGESCEDAANRFVQLGFFNLLPPLDAIARTTTVQDLLGFAKAEGITLRNAKKQDLISMLAHKLGEAELQSRLKTPVFYQLTSAGRELLAAQDQHTQPIVQDLSLFGKTEDSS